MKILNQAKSMNIKTIVFSLFVVVICLNADCNKVEETPVFNGYVLHGRLVNSCTDNTPLKNKTFEFRGENDQIGKEIIKGKTDSNGYFSILSNLKVKYLIMEDGFGLGKTILYKIPGAQTLDLGIIAYNFTVPVNLKYKNFLSIKDKDSIIINYNGGPKSSDLYIKGPLSNENLGIINVFETPIYKNNDSIKDKVILFVNSIGNLSQTKYFTIVPCGITQEVVFD